MKKFQELTIIENIYLNNKNVDVKFCLKINDFKTNFESLNLKKSNFLNGAIFKSHQNIEPSLH